MIEDKEVPTAKKDDDITIKVTEKVRKNDKVYVQRDRTT